MADIAALVFEQLGEEVASSVPLGGGDVADAYRSTLTAGRVVFAKTHPAAPPGFFATEASGLAWLRDAGVVQVPEVLAVSDEPAVLGRPSC